MEKPKLLDLFCGAGGAAMGYARAGFDVYGVDIKNQRKYPFPFTMGDALETSTERYDAIHASPPCQAYSVLNRAHADKTYPDLIGATREFLIDSGLPYIIENVPGAPLIDPVQLCGGYFGLGAAGRYLRRHRLFESNMPLKGTPCNHFEKYAIGVYGHGKWDNNTSTVVGRYTFTSSSKYRRGGYQGTTDEKREAMGIDWMAGEQLTQAIPPAYTEYLGKQLLLCL